MQLPLLALLAFPDARAVAGPPSRPQQYGQVAPENKMALTVRMNTMESRYRFEEIVLTPTLGYSEAHLFAHKIQTWGLFCTTTETGMCRS